MLTVDRLSADGRHAPLFHSTSFSVAPGELILVQAPSQLARTGLSLILTGRMKPGGGTVRWGRDDARSTLRRASELIDSPEVNEIETHMRVRDYVSEMLSYQPHPFLRRPHSGQWLADHDLEDLDNLWDEELTGEQRIRLTVALAHSNSGADLLVFDTPSRHANHSVTWIPRLEQLAQDPDHPRAVVAVVPHISEKWNGPVAIAGESEEETPAGGEHAGPVASDDEADHHVGSHLPASLTTAGSADPRGGSTSTAALDDADESGEDQPPADQTAEQPPTEDHPAENEPDAPIDTVDEPATETSADAVAEAGSPDTSAQTDEDSTTS